MPYRIKNSTKDNLIPRRLALGFAINWIITIVGVIIITFLIDKNIISQETNSVGAVIITLSAAFISSYIIETLQKEKNPLIQILNGSIYFLSMLAINALFFDGEFQGIVGSLLTIIGASVIAALLPSMQKKQRTAYAMPSRKR